MEANFVNSFSVLSGAEGGFKHIRHNGMKEPGTPKKESKTATILNLQPESKDRSKTLYSIAHDLKNPLAAIISLTELVLRRGELTEEIKEYINHIRKISCSSLEFTEDVIYSANIESQANSMKLCDINEIVSEALDPLTYKALEKNQQLSFDSSHAAAEAVVNKAQLTRVFSNIIGNAIKFTEDGKNVHVAVSNLTDYVLVSVKDEGIGIPDKIRAHIFDPFTHAKRDGTAGESSSGLGLSICLQIVEKHHGNIWFEDVADQSGTIFFVRIPKK
ncbi:HAMP domain-containing histidine kinase [Mucilaginibacter sp. JRF]|uniref:sensor histidine kinase n=1 Tax=Mucilaginibacter sp. JRF TaxID=2780088 RepID=UPI00187E855E|nr:HAMP domain-containing sensor histidine kinase [Mucilaginibacter sp. JRF]MBE9583633.1 HAMP domain-containing histidine kinase [Mucilaginibacter sp. JRF]